MTTFGKRIKSLSALVLGLSYFSGFARADDQPATQTQPATTSEEIKALRERLEALENKQKAEEAGVRIDKALADVNRDADRRSQLFAPDVAITAGYLEDKGFVIKSENGDFLFHPWLQFAFRSETASREDSKQGGTTEDTQNGFEVRRAKIGFDGNVFGPDLKYVFIWATDRKTQTLGLEEAWFVYKIGDFGFLPQAVSIEAGQFKNFFAHESMASSKRIFAVERSLLNDVFTGGDNFVQGAALLYNEGNNGGPLQAALAVNDGSNDFSAAPSATSRNFLDFPNNKWDWGVAGRVQFKFFGKWKDYEDFTSVKLSEPLLVVGGAVDYSEAGDFSQLLHTIDAQWKIDRFALYGAFIGRSLRHTGVGGAGTATPNPATAGLDNVYDYGFVGKAGYMMDAKWELFGQYSYIRFNHGEFAAGTETTAHEITVGTNYYFKGHNAKLTADFTWLPNGTPVSSDGGGILAQPNGESEYVLRIQFQLVI